MQLILRILTTILIVLFFTVLSIIFFIKIYHASNEIIVGFLAAFLTFAGVLYAKYMEKIRDIENTQKTEKIRIYGELINIIFDDFLYNQNNNDKRRLKEIDNKLKKNKKEMLLWASDKVLIAYNDIASSDNSQNPLIVGEKLFKAIREDLGHSDKRFRKHEILRVIVRQDDEDFKNLINKK